MAKRAKDQEPYRPVRASLVAEVMTGAAAAPAMQAVVADGLEEVIRTSDGGAGVEDLKLRCQEPHLRDRSGRAVAWQEEIEHAG